MSDGSYVPRARPGPGASPWTRRRALGAVGAAGVFGVGMPALAAAGARRTPAFTEGPFYPTEFPVDSDADLVQVEGRSGEANGVVTLLSGQVVDPDGRPLSGARVEIWQCDARGVYRHERESRGPADPNFQGYGRTRTDADGGYRFRTIRPVPYSGRTPHIHFKLSGPGFSGLTTQMFVEGEPGNRRDFVLNSIRDPELRRSVIVPLEPADDAAPGALRGRFRIVVGRNAR